MSKLNFYDSSERTLEFVTEYEPAKIRGFHKYDFNGDYFE